MVSYRFRGPVLNASNTEAFGSCGRESFLLEEYVYGVEATVDQAQAIDCLHLLVAKRTPNLD